MKGKIVKGIGGFYYVDTASGLVQTRGRGIFRKQGLTPFVGDDVDIEIPENGDGVIREILERRNSFLRLPVANLDCIITVFSPVKPKLCFFRNEEGPGSPSNREIPRKTGFPDTRLGLTIVADRKSVV